MEKNTDFTSPWAKSCTGVFRVFASGAGARLCGGLRETSSLAVLATSRNPNTMAAGSRLDKRRRAGESHTADTDAPRDASSNWRESAIEVAVYTHSVIVNAKTHTNSA
jgi:hypothetical protein